ncbi:hypothetical protein [Shinella sumterensis]|uniref:hypothetical protein n=1 Tax=Shinella sumterensis TaxID=1967501 RepID=UPI00142F9232|nr:hypothetical protein [Shinella sumterensis]MCD1262280.1 hypothetical protein [Shinella sumterensis]
MTNLKPRQSITAAITDRGNRSGAADLFRLIEGSLAGLFGGKSLPQAGHGGVIVR